MVTLKFCLNSAFSFFPPITSFLLTGAYFHENFIQQNRKLSLEITRVKAPRRRRINKTQQKSESQPTLGPLARFTPTSTSTHDINASNAAAAAQNSPHDDEALPSASPQLQDSVPCGQATSAVIPAPKENHTAAQGTSADAPAENSNELSTESSVAETYEWLINAGVPFSSFDPVSIENSPRPKADAGKEGIAPDLFECAEEITSLFSCPSPQI